MNCVWREKEIESKCSNMLTFSDNVDKWQKFSDHSCNFSVSLKWYQNQCLKIPLWRKMKRKSFSHLSLGTKYMLLCVISFSYKPPVFHMTQWASWGERLGSIPLCDPRTCQNMSVSTDDEDEAKCLRLNHKVTLRITQTILAPQPWTLHLLRTHMCINAHTHSRPTLKYFTLNGNLHKNSVLFFCVFNS